MSVRAMTWAWEQDLKAGTKLVLVALADHADGSGVCWPGHDLIAEKCGMSRATVVEHIRLLEEAGLVRSEKTRSGGRAGFTRYFLNLDSEPENEGSNVKKSNVGKSNVGKSNVGISPVPMSGFPISIKEEPKAIEPTTPPKAPQGGQCAIELEAVESADLARESVERWFEVEFWPAYPKRVDKQEALAELLRLKPTAALLQEIAAGLALRKRAEQYAKAKREFFPHWKAPHRWLRKRCWRDEFEVPRETSGPSADRRCRVCGKASTLSDARGFYCRDHDPDMGLST